ncbi:unnamed protein product [Urochloa humidicola]
MEYRCLQLQTTLCGIRGYFTKSARGILLISFQFASGSSNMSDFTFVENVAHANICDEQALCSNAASLAGKLELEGAGAGAL